MVTLTKNAALDCYFRDPDVRLMLKVRGGDAEAFEQLWLRYHPWVRGALEHLMGGHQDSEDLTQEVFLRVFRARTTYVASSKFTTWLFTIVKNVAANARRSLAARRKWNVSASACGAWNPLDGLPAGVQGERPDQPLEREELCEVVHRAIGQLNVRQRTAVLLCNFQQMSQADAARAMNTSAEAVKSLLHRARISLRARLAAYLQDGRTAGATRPGRGLVET